MPLTVKYEHPDFPTDQEFDIAGIGVVTNGEEKELTNEEEIAFITSRRLTVRDGFEDDERMTISGTTSVQNGVEGALGVDPETISDTASDDPTEMNFDELTGEKFEHANLQGAVSEPPDEPVPAVAPVEETVEPVEEPQPVDEPPSEE